MGNIDIILLKDINIGGIGDVIKVKTGYAVNFLFPQKIALPVSLKNIKNLNHQKKLINRQKIIMQAKYEKLAQEMTKSDLVISARTTEKGKLFGSITSKDVAQLLEKKGFDVSSRYVSIEAIKTIGVYPIKINFPTSINFSCKLTVISEDI